MYHSVSDIENRVRKKCAGPHMGVLNLLKQLTMLTVLTLVCMFRVQIGEASDPASVGV